MRKTLIFLLLASVTAPALAAADEDDRRGRRGENAQRADDDRESRRSERPARAERSNDGERSAAIEQRRERRARTHDRGGPADDRPADSAPALVQSDDAPDRDRTRRSRERFRENGPTVIQERNRDGAEVLSDRRAGRDAPAISRIPRAGTQPPPRSASRSASRSRDSNHRWRGDWRSDRRYDWRNHRRRYSSLFNFGFYRDPFGWGYQPFSIGWRMWPSYYSRSYWLNDPWQYRLPYAPAGYRWIRYYDDAILVDTWDGQVVDVIRNFFW
jgi:Ni/Co efflux regulator RcnB